MKTRNIGKILNKKENMKKHKYVDNPRQKIKYEKNKYEENPEPKKNRVEKKKIKQGPCIER